MLTLDFSTRPGRIEVGDDEDIESLNWLRSRFSSASSVSATVFDVEIADFLLNLHELAEWPGDPDKVMWAPRLLDLVEGNADDELAFSQSIDADPADGEINLPTEDPWDGLTREQVRDSTRLLGLRHGANFSVPGAGKTRAALAVFEARRLVGEVSRLLVIAPKSAFESWRDEIGLCFVEARALRVQFLTDGQIDPAADAVVVNYERLPTSAAMLIAWLQGAPTLLVLDEAHRVKLGARGAWGSVCLSMAPFAQRRLILSGTPAPNGARDLENLFSFVWPGLGARAVQSALQGKDLRAASARLQPMFVRTTKAELDLPPLDLVVRRVELTSLHRELYHALLDSATSSLSGNGADLEAMGRVTMYLLMAATTPALLATGASAHDPLRYRVPPLVPIPGSSLESLLRDLPQYELTPKYQEVLKIVSDNAALGRKTLVWSTFVRNLTSLARLLAPFRPAVVHGGTEDREIQISRFRTDPDCLVLLSNPATLGEGVSLHHECHDSIYVDRDFAAGRFMQSLDRTHRLGLPPATVTRATILMSPETIDEVVEARLSLKIQFMGTVLNDPAVLQLGDLSEEESQGPGMDLGDVQAILGYLRSHGD